MANPTPRSPSSTSTPLYDTAEGWAFLARLFTGVYFGLMAVVLLVIGVLLLAPTSAHAQGTSYRADEYDRATHMEHFMKLQRWEIWAGREALALAREIRNAVREPRRTHHGRVEQVLELENAVWQLGVLSVERYHAAEAGFCSDTSSRSIFLQIDGARLMAESLMLSIRTLQTAEQIASRRHRRILERSAVESFFATAEKLTLASEELLIELDRLYRQVLTFGSSCGEVYGTEEFAAARERLFYEPTVGWPIPSGSP